MSCTKWALLLSCHILLQRMLYYISLQISTTIVGMLEKEIICSNIDALLPLDDHELEVQEELRKRFSQLKVCHWEGIEVAKYWSDMKKSI